MTASRLRGIGSWALGRGEQLGGRVVAVSVHLDDAVFSVGAALSCAARHGADVTVLTVLANDPSAEQPVSDWDRRAGFATARAAASARRAEDRRACELVGARPVWLPFGDKAYGRGAADAEIADAVVAHLQWADVVLLPGFPLVHPDHRWLGGLLEGRVAAPRIGRYVEQPYTALWTSGADPEQPWQTLAAAPRDRIAKLRASRAYSSQLPPLEGSVLKRTLRYEAGRGGEAVIWA
jgi:LmbE family N-acetylglucosaminyl deacetylase